MPATVHRSATAKDASRTITTTGSGGVRKARVVARPSAAPEPDSDMEEALQPGEEEEEEEVPKRRRTRAGTGALREVRRQQKRTDYAFARAPYRRLIKELLREKSADPTMRVTQGAVDAAQTWGEEYLLTVDAWAVAQAVMNKRVTVLPKDVRMVQLMQPSGKPPNHWTTAEMDDFDELARSRRS